TLLAALAWWYIAAGSSLRGSPAMSEMGTPSPGALVLMWSLMMVGMMLPSAAPAILLYARGRAARGDDPAIAGTWVFVVGYLTVWLLFSIVAAILQHMLADSRMTFGN